MLCSVGWLSSDVQTFRQHLPAKTTAIVATPVQQARTRRNCNNKATRALRRFFIRFFTITFLALPRGATPQPQRPIIEIEGVVSNSVYNGSLSCY